MGKKIPRPDPTQPQKKARTVLSVPSVNSTSGFTSGSSGTRDSPDDDQLYIAIMEYNSDGSLYNGLFEWSPMYVMQLKTNAYPSPLFKLKIVLGLQWKEENTKDPDLLQLANQSHLSHSEEKGPQEFFLDFESAFHTLFVWSPKKVMMLIALVFNPIGVGSTSLEVRKRRRTCSCIWTMFVNFVSQTVHKAWMPFQACLIYK